MAKAFALASLMSPSVTGTQSSVQGTYQLLKPCAPSPPTPSYYFPYCRHSLVEEAGGAAYDYTATYFLKRQRKVYRRRRRPATAAAAQGGNDLDPESLPSQLFWNKWNINSGEP